MATATQTERHEKLARNINIIMEELMSGDLVKAVRVVDTRKRGSKIWQKSR